MRLATAFFLCFFACQTSTAQESVAQKFLAVLSAHPDKDAVQILKSDVETGKIKVALNAQMILVSFDGWENTAARTVYKLVAQKTIILPSDFFFYSPCHQKTLVEVSGLGHDYLSKLGSDFVGLLTRFSDPNLAEDVNEEDQKPLNNLVAGFEKAATDNVDRFSKLLFRACSAEEREEMFGAIGSAASAEDFAGKTKKQIRDTFENFKLMIQQ